MLIQELISFFKGQKTHMKAVVVGLAVLLLIFLVYGYRLETTTGTVSLYVPESGARIFVDEKQVGVSRRGGESILLRRISPGERSIIVQKQGAFPWGKTITVEKGITTETSAFLVSKNLSAVVIVDEEDRARVSSIFSRTQPNTKQANTKDIEVSRNGKEITVTWIGEGDSSLPFYFCQGNTCEKTITVFTALEGDITAVDFYPGRKDIVLFALQNNIYAIEVDKEGRQNFQPVYTGIAPTFVVQEFSPGLYIQDDGELFKLEL